MERGTKGKSGRRGNNEGSNPIQRADGRWQINVRYTDESGKSHRRSVSGRTAQEVRTKRDALRKRITAGQPASDSSAPVSTFVESWIASTLAVSSRKQSTKLLYGTVARKHISDTALGRTRLSRVKPSTVEAWLVEVRGRGLSDSTVRTCYTVLRAVFDTAVRDEAVATNPVAKIPRPPVRKKEAACLSASEAADLLESARDSRYAPLFRFLVNTATRRGEALALQWSDIDFTKKLIHVRHTLARVDGVLQRIDPKSIKSRRVIPMSDETVAILMHVRTEQKKDRLRAGSKWNSTGFVFTTEFGMPCDPRNALRAFKTAADKAGLSNVTLHTLRHSAATLMLMNGTPVKVVSEVLGHSSISITGDIYGHVNPDVARDALAGLGTSLANGVR